MAFFFELKSRPDFIIEKITKTSYNILAHQLEKTKNLEFHIRDVQEDKLHHFEVHEFYSRKIGLQCSTRNYLVNYLVIDLR